MRAVCIHGHFYQPPRENPWVGVVGRQRSARPFHDWNERITVECYAPNAEARVLDADVSRRVSNYRQLSFDVGPTLHEWLAVYAPEVDHAIVDAGRRRGAIAQAYNHVILPLADGLTKELQIRWGIRDFEHRFGRAPEGLWLPETAVDTPTLEVLARHGIRFAIVAPHQIARVKAPGSDRWLPTTEAALDTRRPYLARTVAGDVAIFAYDGSLARAVAFEGALHDGRALAERLADAALAADEPALVHLATDGESYGHHHAHGEMALAAIWGELERRGVPTTTYGEYLAAHPASWECEIAERTSWSCAHGVERWRSACGCSLQPGTSQGWRAPLRLAADHLWRAVRDTFPASLEPILADWIDVHLGREPAAAVFARHGVEETPRARLAIETAWVAQRAFTSCGWFFDDLGGLEAVQIVRYLVRGSELIERWSPRPVALELRTILADAHAGDGTSGAATFDRVIARDRAAPLDLAALWARHAVTPRDEGPPSTASLERLALEAIDGSHRGEVTVRMRDSGEAHTHGVVIGRSGEAWAGPPGATPGTPGWRRAHSFQDDG
jgi:alpha-amylase/alpha-mannosidase (GH57 family)